MIRILALYSKRELMTSRGVCFTHQFGVAKVMSWILQVLLALEVVVMLWLGIHITVVEGRE